MVDVTAIERRMYFDVWAGDDLNGACIGTLTYAREKQVHIVDNAIGSFSFAINRNTDEFVGLCATDNLVRVRLDPDDDGPYDYDDSRYRWAFVLESGNDAILDDQEEAGEVARLGGRSWEGPLLERILIDWEAHFVDDIANHPYDRTALKDGQWHFSGDIPGAFAEAGSPGSVLRIVVRNSLAMVPAPFPELGLEFNINVDSNGDPWDDDEGRFDFDVGTDGRTVLEVLVKGGLWYRPSAELHLFAWSASQGVDRTDTVVFEKGLNVLASGVREINATKARSRVLVQGSSKTGYKYRWVNEDGGEDHHDDLVAGATEDEIGVRHGFVDYQYSPTNVRLERAGATFMREAKDNHAGPPSIDVVDHEDHVAFVDYDVGDTVALVLPDLPDSARISSIDLIDDPATGYVRPRLTFLAQPIEPQVRRNGAPGGGTIGGSRRGISAPPANSDEIPVDEGEVLLVWWYPATADIEINGVDIVNDLGNMGYVNGPGTYEISTPDSDVIFHWVVVSGIGTTEQGA